MNIGILGLGAIGTLMAWKWRSQTVFALTPDHTSCQRQLLDQDQQQHSLNIPVWQQQPLDWLVVCTKAQDTLEALTLIKPRLSQIKRILLLQNGLGQQGDVSRWLEQSQSPVELWAGMSTEGAYRKDKTRVVYAGAGDTRIGRWQPSGSSMLSLNQTELPQYKQLPYVQVEQNIANNLREKLAINAVINPLTAHFDCPNGALVSDPNYRARTLQLAGEISELYQLLGWQLSFDLTERSLDVAQATANNFSSTVQDRRNGRTTELDYISGYLLTRAKAIQLAMPHTRALYDSLITKNE